MKSATTHVNAKDAQGKTALHEASRWGHVPVIQFLLDNKAEIESKTVEGSTALHLAARFGQDDAVNFLVSKGANIDAQDVFQDTPLIAASGAGKVSTCSLLLRLGADKTIRNELGRDALACAKDTDTTEALKDETHQSFNKY